MASIDRSHTSFYSSSIATNGPILYSFRDKARYWSKIAIFIPLLHNNSLDNDGCKYFLLVFFHSHRDRSVIGGVNRFSKVSYVYSQSQLTPDLQCEPNKFYPLLRFSDFFPTAENFKVIFYTLIVRLSQITKFYSIISNFNKVMPY